METTGGSSLHTQKGINLMKTHIIKFSTFKLFTLYLLLLSIGFSQETSITNLQVAQRTDGSKLVDIFYDLGEDAVFTDFNIQVEVSFDGGSTWQETYYVEGDVFFGIMPGEDKAIIWNLGAEYPGTFNDNVKVRLTATGTVAGPLPFEMVSVPSGDYTYGNGDEVLSIDYDYEISKYPITNAQYAEFLIEAYELGLVWISGGDVEGYYTGDEHYGPGNYDFYDLGTNTGSYNYGQIDWNGTTFTVPEGYGSHPVIEVSWFGADAFAQFYGLRLPDEYEWEKAARGNTGNDYPWGNSISGDNANYWDSGDPWDNGTTPIGYFNGENGTTDSPSPYGAYDMAGNVWEWTDSWWSDGSSGRVIRGGSWVYSAYALQSWGRNDVDPIDSDSGLGFRCSRTQ